MDSEPEGIMAVIDCQPRLFVNPLVLPFATWASLVGGIGGVRSGNSTRLVD